MNRSDIESAVSSYIVTGLWATPDYRVDGQLDENYVPSDVAPETIAAITIEVTDFINSCEEERPGIFDNMNPAQIGHDFLLTRDRHGAGFWDRGLGEVGDYLTSMAHPYGDSGFYVGDDGRVYVQ